MKRYFLFMLIIPFLLFVSCSEDFEINAPDEDVYILKCILRNDNTFQYAIISKNEFSDDGTPPASAGNDQNIKGADVKISYNDSVFVMRDTTLRIIESGKETNVNCYYMKNLTLRPGMSIRIKASIQNGKVLESNIRIPEITFANFSIKFPHDYKSGYQLYPLPSYKWDWNGDTEEQKNILNVPQLEVYYKKKEGGTFIDKKILVPLALYYRMEENGRLTPVPVKLSFDNQCLTTLTEMNKTMQELSGDDPYKKNYIITKVTFNVISLDTDLTRFYSAYSVHSEGFSIKLRQTDYSNIDGGKGIFGAYYIFSKSLTVDSLYVNSFGYQWDPIK